MDNFSKIKSCFERKQYDKVFYHIKEMVSPSADYSTLTKLNAIYEKLDKKMFNLNHIKVAVLSSSTIDHLSHILKLHLATIGFEAEIKILEFNTIQQNILNDKSELYAFKPDIVWIFNSYRDFQFNHLNKKSNISADQCVNINIQQTQNLWLEFRKRSTAYILQNNMDIPIERVLGNFEGSVSWSRIQLLRKYNYDLTKVLIPGVSIIDLDFLSSVFGKNKWFDDRFWYLAKQAFSLDALSLVSFTASRVIRATKGQSKKCIVLDLDNTVWGGIIGEDGLSGIQLGQGSVGEAYLEFQKYLKELKERGILLAVCSKNEIETAKEPFFKHPEMQLKFDDFSVFIANWNNKADNIRLISKQLNLNLDSIVFIDEDPAERELVQKELPMVSTPNLTDDPADFKRQIDAQCFFETVGLTDEDLDRTEQYKQKLQRDKSFEASSDIKSFLKGLQMKVAVNGFNSFNLQRISQLINKSNQFNLTTRRYNESQVQEIINDPNCVTRFYRLKDKFGDNGIVSLIIIRKQELNEEWFIDTWLMSCRVLSRDLEKFVNNDIVKLAYKNKIKKIIGLYTPTAKNSIVKNHYQDLGYTKVQNDNEDSLWSLDVERYVPFELFFEEE